MRDGHRTNERLTGRVAVLSPHLDDAALSLGAAIAAATRHGVEVRVVNVFCNDPDDERPARSWDRTCGFATTGEAARARREEDERSCALLGATTVWLPFADAENADDAVDDELLSGAVREVIADADVVLLPGSPLLIADHERVARLVLGSRPAGARLGLYVEQPYAALALMSRGGRVGSGTPVQGVANGARILLGGAAARGLAPDAPAPAIADLAPDAGPWRPLASDRGARRVKRRAIDAHRSQVRSFGPLVLERIALYERAAGGESVAWLPDRAPAG